MTSVSSFINWIPMVIVVTIFSIILLIITEIYRRRVEKSKEERNES